MTARELEGEGRGGQPGHEMTLERCREGILRNGVGEKDQRLFAKANLVPQALVQENKIRLQG